MANHFHPCIGRCYVPVPCEDPACQDAPDGRENLCPDCKGAAVDAYLYAIEVDRMVDRAREVET